jgi:hypothetical protein
VGNLTLVTTTRRLGLAAGVPVGIGVLAALVLFVVALPQLTEDGEVELPDSLPGGWVAVDLATLPGEDEAGSADPEAITEGRLEATEYVRRVYADIYDDPVAFRAYTDAEFSTFVVVTVFTSDGGAFGPPNGIADPEALELKRPTTELVRDGDVVCVVNFAPIREGEVDTDDSGVPLGVSCQLPTAGHTIQLASNGVSLDDTVQLVHDVADRI